MLQVVAHTGPDDVLTAVAEQLTSLLLPEGVSFQTASPGRLGCYLELLKLVNYAVSVNDDLNGPQVSDASMHKLAVCAGVCLHRVTASMLQATKATPPGELNPWIDQVCLIDNCGSHCCTSGALPRGVQGGPASAVQRSSTLLTLPVRPALKDASPRWW